MEKVFDIYIRTTPEQIWEAITDDEIQGSYSFTPPEDLAGDEFATGETVESDAPNRLVRTMKANWSPEVAREPESRIAFEIRDWRNGISHLRVTHSGLREGGSEEIWGGWPMILSSLKSLLETGEPLKLEIPAEAIEQWREAKAAAG
jgi:uncharacterized protein YndB with AHSA1/START domain